MALVSLHLAASPASHLRSFWAIVALHSQGIGDQQWQQQRQASITPMLLQATVWHAIRPCVLTHVQAMGSEAPCCRTSTKSS